MRSRILLVLVVARAGYARSVQVKSGGAYSFSLNDKDLVDCSR
jgi:hypothetical protein